METGNGTAGVGSGISLTRNSVVSAGGAGTLTVTGTGSALGSASTRYNHGVEINCATLRVENGNMHIDGNAGGNGNGNRNYGVYSLRSTTEATGAGNINIDGTGGQNGSGINITYGSLSANSGNLNLTGTGGAGASKNHGIYILRASVQTTGGGDMTLLGQANGSTTGLMNSGVWVDRCSMGVTGDCWITGAGGGGTLRNHGVYINGVSSTGNAPTVGRNRRRGRSIRRHRRGLFPVNLNSALFIGVMENLSKEEELGKSLGLVSPVCP